MNVDFVADMVGRGLLYQVSSPDLSRVMAAERLAAYIGFDPTARSLHVGSLLPVVTLMRWQRAGHRPIAIVGGGTGLIGDPSGKEAERPMLRVEDLQANLVGLREQLGRFLDFGEGQALMVDNAEWLCRVPLVDFLRDVGKHFSVNAMIDRDSVKKRLETREQGISYTEFSYMLLQAYDFLELYDRCGCRVQMGGSDQWGNILSGVDLIRRVRGVEAFGLTFPLITRADGRKFGKSEQGNVWLDAELTTPFEFYQFWINTDDEDAARYLRYFTFLEPEALADLDSQAAARKEGRACQQALARELTHLVHGADAMARAERITDLLFQGGDLRDLSAADVKDAFAHAPGLDLSPGALGTRDALIAALLVDSGLCASRSRAREDLQSGAIQVNGRPVTDTQATLSAGDLLAGGVAVLRRGKKTYKVVRVSGPV